MFCRVLLGSFRLGAGCSFSGVNFSFRTLSVRPDPLEASIGAANPGLCVATFADRSLVAYPDRLALACRDGRDALWRGLGARVPHRLGVRLGRRRPVASARPSSGQVPAIQLAAPSSRCASASDLRFLGASCPLLRLRLASQPTTSSCGCRKPPLFPTTSSTASAGRITLPLQHEPEHTSMEFLARAVDLGYGYVKYSKGHLSASGDLPCDAFPSTAPQSYGHNDVDGGVMRGLDVIPVEIDGQTYLVGPQSLVAAPGLFSRMLDDSYFTSPQYLALSVAPCITWGCRVGKSTAWSSGCLSSSIGTPRSSPTCNASSAAPMSCRGVR